MAAIYLHEYPKFKMLIETISEEMSLGSNTLCEKDYWIMHCLYGLKNTGLYFELKGGTSLSKGYGIISRFSEDIDIRIEPDEKIFKSKVFSGKNQDSDKHRESRKIFFENIAAHLGEKIHGIGVELDTSFNDDGKYRNGCIKLIYQTMFPIAPGVKPYILLEVGFDRTTPFRPLDISSWAFDRTKIIKTHQFKDNRALAVPCYEPRFTFVEKLHAVIRKFRQFKASKESKSLPSNFIRHYYDLYSLLNDQSVAAFIGTTEYEEYKKLRFKNEEAELSKCCAFALNREDFDLFNAEYERTSLLYYSGKPSFFEICEKLMSVSGRL